MYIIFALVPLLLLYISAWIGSWFLWDCVNCCSIVQERGRGGGSRVVARSESLTVKAVACLIRCRKGESCTRYERYKIAFITLNKGKIKIRIHYQMAKASENSVVVRGIFVQETR